MIFEWDPVKAVKNLREHGIAFEEAITVFDDDRAIVEVDPDQTKRGSRSSVWERRIGCLP